MFVVVFVENWREEQSSTSAGSILFARQFAAKTAKRENVVYAEIFLPCLVNETLTILLFRNPQSILLFSIPRKSRIATITCANPGKFLKLTNGI